MSIQKRSSLVLRPESKSSQALSTPSPGDRSPGNSQIPQKAFWTVVEIANLLNLSTDTVRRMFRDEVDVIRFRTRSSLRRRPYQTLRIPDRVLRRVLRNLSVGKGIASI
jgi:hypothetical protein